MHTSVARATPSHRRGLRVAVLAVSLALGLWTLLVHQRLVAAETRVDAARGGVEIVLSRRGDLIPNLARVAAGASSHDRGVASLVAGTAGVPLVEGGGDLPASEAYLRLAHEIAGSDNRVATELARFNAAVHDYEALRRRWFVRPVADLLRVPSLRHGGS